MPLSAVVLARTHLVRQSVANSLSLLDLTVHELSDVSEAVADLNTLNPSLIVMDADGMAREWRLLASGLAMTSIGLVLLATRFGFDDAHEALQRRIAAVIVKPFRKEEHAARLLDIALRGSHTQARRSAPRFAIARGEQARLQLQEEGAGLLAVRNLSEGGVGVEIDNQAMASIQPGAPVCLATLAWGGINVDLSLEVVHRSAGLVGMRVMRALDGKPQFTRALEEQRERTLGPQGRKRRW